MKCKKLIYKSPLHGSVQCEELFHDRDGRVDFGPAGAMSLYNRGPEVLTFLTEHSEDLADHVCKELKDLVVSAVFGECSEEEEGLYLVTGVYVRKEPTEEQLQKIHDWVSGQMSDGWGESLEQKVVLEERVGYSTTTFDEDICEFEQEDGTAYVQYFLHPWVYPGWHLELVGSEEAEFDAEEPDINEELRQTVLKIKELVDEIVEELKKIT